MKRLTLVLAVIGIVAVAAIGAYALAEGRAGSAPAQEGQAAVSDANAPGPAVAGALCHPLQDRSRCRFGDADCASCPSFKDADKDGVCDVRGQCAGHQGAQGHWGAQQGRGCRFAGPCH